MPNQYTKLLKRKVHAGQNGMMMVIIPVMVVKALNISEGDTVEFRIRQRIQASHGGPDLSTFALMYNIGKEE